MNEPVQPNGKTVYDIVREKIFDISPEVIVIVDPNGVVQYANNKTFELLGCKPEEMMGKSLLKFNFLTTKGKAIILKNLALRVAGQSVPPYEIEFITKQGNRKIGRFIGEVVRNSEGKAVGNLVMISDITEQRQIEESSRIKEKESLENQRKYRDYVESAPYGMFVVNEEGEFIDANKQICTMAGYSKEELLVKSMEDLVSPEAIEEFVENFREIMEKGEVSCELPFLTKNGVKRFWFIKMVRLSDEKYLGFATDVSEKKDTKESLQESEDRFRKVFENADIIFIHFDEVGNILDLNKRAQEVFKEKKEKLEGRHFSKTGLFLSSDIPVLAKSFTDVLAGKSSAIEVHARDRDGKEIDLEGIVVLIKEDKLTNLMLIARDVTEQRLAKRFIEKKARELKKANQLMIGRELRVVELKNEIAKLKRKLGQDTKI